MKTNVTKDKLKVSFATAFWVILFNFLFSIVCFFLLWYWLIPKTFPLFPNFAYYLQHMDDDSLLKAYDIFYTVGSILAIFPSVVVAYRLSGRRKKDFLKISGGRISYGEGIRYHLTEYGISDGIAFATMSLLGIILAVAMGRSLKVFPLALYMYLALGAPLGFIVTVVVIISSAFGGVFFAQKKWRADYFVGE